MTNLVSMSGFKSKFFYALYLNSRIMLRGDKDHISFSGKDLTRFGWVENEKCGNAECGVRSLESEECGEKKKTKRKN